MFRRRITGDNTKRGIIIGAIGIVVLFTVGITIDSVVMPYIVRAGQESMVPEVAEMDIEMAKQILEENDFGWSISSEEFSATKPRFTVLKQQPPSGLKVKTGRIVELTISKGGEVGMIGELRGSTLRQAKFRLSEDGFTTGLVTFDYDEELHPGVIIRTYPPAGAQAKRGSPIDLVVNIRRRTVLVFVPDYIGTDVNFAQSDLLDRGLAFGEIKYTVVDSILPETILSQSLVAGMEVEEKTPISFTVSKLLDN